MAFTTEQVDQPSDVPLLITPPLVLSCRERLPYCTSKDDVNQH
jgi:hypothetical protein